MSTCDFLVCLFSQKEKRSVTAFIMLYAEVSFRGIGFIGISLLLTKLSLYFFRMITISIEASDIANNKKALVL